MPASYEEQQAQYQKLAEGENDEPAPIEVPREPEVNPDVYKDVESLLFRGFLTQRASIGDVSFVFKSLNHHEYENISFMGGFEDDGAPTKQFWSLFIAHSVFMLDGYNVLPDRTHWIPKFAKEFSDWQVAVKNKVVRYLSELNRKSRRSLILTECYCLEKYSRYRWLQVGEADLTSPSLTGIAGTGSLGMNWSQLTWRALNRIEDFREAMEQQWEHAKFIGSCSAGKGIQKVYSRDIDRRKKEREDKLARKDNLLHHVFDGDPIAERVTRRDGAVMVRAESTEELIAQFKQDLKGEKDWHDVVVDKYEARAHAAEQAREEHIRELHASHEREFQGKALIGGTDMTGLSPAQVRDRMIRQRQLEGQVSQAQEQAQGPVARPPLPRAPRTELEEIDTSFGTTDQGSDGVVPLPVNPRPAGVPFNRRR